MIAWMVYAALAGGIVAVGGLAMEKLAAAMGRPRRIAWVVALTLGIVIPPTGGWRSPAAAPVVETVAPPAAISGVEAQDSWSAIPTPPMPRRKDVGRVALLVWGAGSLASLACLASVLVLVARGRRRWERRSVDGVDVYVSRRFGPALVGVARPEVVVPSWVLGLEPGSRAAIIRHELEHARARDHLLLLYGGLVATAFPWSPAIWWMYWRLRAGVELDCDQRVLGSGIGVADYGDVLLNAVSRSRGRRGFAPAMSRLESFLERRLKTMSEKRKKLSGGRAALLTAVAVGALVVACDTAVPMDVGEAPGKEELDDRIEQLMQATGFSSSPAPLLYVDGVRITKTAELPKPVREWFDSGLGESDVVERVEVAMGSAAWELFDDVADEESNGAFQIFTGGRDRPAEVIVVPLHRKRPAAERAETGDSGQVPGGNPLIIVDDMPVDNAGLSALGPIVIDGIFVVGNPAAALLFGPDASDGVIQIYTERSRHAVPGSVRE